MADCLISRLPRHAASMLAAKPQTPLEQLVAGLQNLTVPATLAQVPGLCSVTPLHSMMPCSALVPDSALPTPPAGPERGAGAAATALLCRILHIATVCEPWPPPCLLHVAACC